MPPVPWLRSSRFSSMSQTTPGQSARRRARRPRFPLTLELLEDRTLLSANSFATALPLTLLPDGTGSQSGILATAGDVDVFRFVAPRTGGLTIHEAAAQDSGLHPLLTVFDDTGKPLASSDDTLGLGQSQVALEGQSGQVFFVQAAADGAGSGAYQLTFAPYTDDFGNSPATAPRFPVSTTGTGSQEGVVEVAGDVDVFRFVAPLTSGFVFTEEASSNSQLNPALSLLDSTGQPLASSADTLGLGRTVFGWQLQAGQTYFVQAAGYGVSTGAYQVSVAPFSDDFGNTLAAATPVALSATGSGSQAGTIEVPGDVDVFQVTGPASGRLSLVEAAAGSALSPSLTVFDSTGQQIASSDDVGGTGRSAVAVQVVPGQTYYVQAAGHLASTGAYTVTFASYTDDVGNTRDAAAALTLPPSGNATQAGTIEVPGDVDVFQFVSPISGALTVREAEAAASGLYPSLTVFDGSGQQLAASDDTTQTGQSLVCLQLAAGQTYYVQAAGDRASTGAYTLTFTAYADDAGNTLATARPFALSPSGGGSQAGTVEVPGDVDVFQLVAPRTGALALSEAAVPGSSLAPSLTVFDAAGQPITTAVDPWAIGLAQTTLQVLAGQTYYVQAAGRGTSTGSYALTATPYDDDAGNTLATAQPLTLSASGGSQDGAIEVPGDVDVFQFVAVQSGRFTVRQETAPGSTLQSAVTVFDSLGHAFTGGATADGKGSAVALQLSAGQTYYVQAAGAASTTGSYTLSFVPYTDDASNTPAGADLLTLSATGTGTQTGTIEVPGDVDVFQFAAPLTGTLLISQADAKGSELSGSLLVLDSSGNSFAGTSTQAGSQVVLQVIAGQRYYVEAAGTGTSTGAYLLTFSSLKDDFGNTLAEATLLTLSSTGAGSQNGTIEVAGDVDVFRFVAPVTGALAIDDNPSPGSYLSPTLAVYDSSGYNVAFGTFFTYPGSQATLHVVAGQTYYVQAGSGYSTGTYQLTFTPYTDDAGNTTAQATPLTLSPAGSASQNGTIEVAGDVDVFQFTAPISTALILRVAVPSGSTLIPLVTASDSAGNSYAGLNDNELVLDMVAGQTYYVQVGASPYTYGLNSSTGAYQLTIDPYADDVGNTPVDAKALTMAGNGSATQLGNIDVPGDVDVFRFVAPVSGALAIRQDPTPGSTVVADLRLFDSSGNFSYGTSVGNSSVAVLTVMAGQTYYVQAGGSAGTGGYELSLALYADDAGNTQADATPLAVDATGAASHAGSLEVVGDVDVFQYTATVSTALAVSVSTTSALSVYWTVWDSAGDYYYGYSGNPITLEVVAGQTYYVEVSAYDWTGVTPPVAYQLTLAPYTDDAGNTQADATPLAVDASGDASHAGSLEVAGDVDVFQYTATVSTALAVSLSATSTMNLEWTVWDNASDYYYGSSSNPTTLEVAAGQTYYVEVSTYDWTGVTPPVAYQLTITPYTDDAGNTQADATPLTVDASGAASKAGTLEVAGDVDVFQYTATVSTALSVSLSTDGSLLASLNVWDNVGDYAYGYSGSPATLDVVAGQTYYVEVSAYDWTGATPPVTYQLTLAPYTDDAGNDIAHAKSFTPNRDGTGTQAGTIEVPGDVDYFQFVAPVSGALAVRLDPTNGSSLSASLSVLDNAGNTYSSVSLGNSSQAALDVVAGQTYYVEVSASSGTGTYQLTLTPYTDDAGNTQADATPLSVDAAGAASQNGTLEVAGDVDVFQYVAPISTALLTISMSASDTNDLSAWLKVWDSAGNSYPVVGTGAGAQATLAVEAGQVYYVEVYAYDWSGITPPVTYQVTVTNDLTNAVPLTFQSDGTASQGGAIAGPGDAYYFSLTAPSTGTLEVTQEATAGSGLYSLVQAFDATGQLLAYDDFTNWPDGHLVLQVDAGKTYYIEASAAYSSTGTYLLSLDMVPVQDDVGNDAAHAKSFQLNSDGTGSQAGTIEIAGDVDVFTFTAATSGPLVIRQDAATGSALDSSLTVWDNSFDYYYGVSFGTRGSQVALDMVAGQTYYIQAAGYGQSTGQYNITLFPYSDDVGNTPSQSKLITLSATGTGTQTGTIEVAGDVDVYRFVSPVTGQMTVRQDSVPGSTLTSSLFAFDYNSFDDYYYGSGATTSTSQVSFPVQAGQTYYVQASGGYNGSTGGYQLTFTPTVDDFGNTPATAHLLTLASNNSGRQSGSIETAGDVDVFQFVAQATGGLSIEMDPAAGGSLTSSLIVFGSASTTAASVIPIGARSSQAALHVVAGQTYYIEASGGYSGTTGGYTITLTPYNDDYGNDPGSAQTLTLATSGSTTQTGAIEVAADVDYFQFTAPVSGQLTVREDPALGSNLSGSLILQDASGLHWAYGTSVGTFSDQVSLRLTAGQTYYLAVSGGYSDTVGAYRLTFTLSPDDFGNDLTSAYPLTLAPDNSGSQAGTIEVAGDVDMFRITPTTTGPLVIRLGAIPGSRLATALVVYDRLGRQLATDAGTGDIHSSQVAIDVTAGQTYYIAAQGQDSSTGGYTVSFAPYVDDVGNDVAHAALRTVSSAGQGSWQGTIEVGGDVDVFRIKAPLTGALVVQQTPASGSGLYCSLTILDGTGHVLATDDGSGNTQDSQAAFSVVAGQTYYVEASGYGSSTGGYQVTVSKYVDDFGDDFAHAAPLTLSATATTVQQGTIGLPADVDMFQFVAPANGMLIVRQEATAGSNLDSSLTLFDHNQQPIAYNDNSSVYDGTNNTVLFVEGLLTGNTILFLDSHLGSLNSLLAYQVVAGQTYYVQAAGAGASTGAYRLFLSLVQSLDVSAGGTTQVKGTITAPGDLDVFQFVAPQTGSLLVRQDAATGSSLDSLLTVFDGANQQVAFNDDYDAQGNSQVVFHVVAGQTYYVQAAGLGASTGAYVLSLAAYQDDFGNDFATAHALTLSSSGAGQQAGAIETGGDVDMFQFVAPFTGPMLIRQNAASGSTLDSTLTVFGSSGTQLAFDDNSGTSLNSEVVVNVQAGQTYYVQAAGYGDSTGPYVLTFAAYQDDFGDTPATAQPLTVPAAGTVTQAGTIGTANDLDVFQITAAAAGTVAVRLEAAADSSLHAVLSIFDQSGQPLSQDNTFGDTGDSQVLLPVAAGQTYYVQVGSADGSSGGYVLALATPRVLTLTPSGKGTQNGTLAGPGDVSLFQFTAPVSGSIVVHQGAAAGSNLDSSLTVRDATGQLLAANDDSGGTFDSQVALDLTAGQTYYVLAAGHGASSGAYQLTFTPYQDDAANTLAGAPLLTLSAADTGHKTGTIEVAGDVDYYRFVARVTGLLTIELAANNGSLLDPNLTLYDGAGLLLASNDDSNGTLNSRVSLHVEAGQTYYVEAGASTLAFSQAATGTYELLFGVPATTTALVRNMASVPSIALDSSGHGVAKVAVADTGEVATVAFTAPVTRLMTLQVTRTLADATVGSAGTLELFDASGTLVASDTAVGDSGMVRFKMTAGQQYFVEVGGPGESAANYRFTFGDDFGSDFGSAQTLAGVTTGTANQVGTIDTTADVDFFQFVAPTTGQLGVQLNTAAGTALIGQVQVFNANHDLLGTFTAGPELTNQLLAFDVTAGQAYFVAVDAATPGTGKYELAFDLSGLSVSASGGTTGSGPTAPVEGLPTSGGLLVAGGEGAGEGSGPAFVPTGPQGLANGGQGFPGEGLVSSGGLGGTSSGSSGAPGVFSTDLAGLGGSALNPGPQRLQVADLTPLAEGARVALIVALAFGNEAAGQGSGGDAPANVELGPDGLSYDNPGLLRVLLGLEEYAAPAPQPGNTPAAPPDAAPLGPEGNVLRDRVDPGLDEGDEANLCAAADRCSSPASQELTLPEQASRERQRPEETSQERQLPEDAPLPPVADAPGSPGPGQRVGERPRFAGALPAVLTALGCISILCWAPGHGTQVPGVVGRRITVRLRRSGGARA